MVGQKKRKSDCWLNYKENFSSLIAADGNNERLSCKKAKVHMFPKYRKYEENGNLLVKLDNCEFSSLNSYLTLRYS